MSDPTDATTHALTLARGRGSEFSTIHQGSPLLERRPARVLLCLAVTLGAAMTLSGCALFGLESDGAGDNPGRDSGSEESSEAEIDDSSWACYYDPTMNDDWHDDVICRNGDDSRRPRLLTKSDFVTEKEMIEAGQKYAAKLNK